MSVGSFVFVLHSHLPFYRKAGMWPFGEESVYECMAETYIPLLNAIAELKDEGIKANLTLGITPVLAEQLSDEHLKEGFVAYCNRKIEAAQIDEARFKPRGESPNPELLHLSRFYQNWYASALNSFTERWGRDIIGALKGFQDEGLIEITTSCATHCLSPLLEEDTSLNLQFQTGLSTYKKHFGKTPRGFWLPECAYRPADEKRPGIGHYLNQIGIEYFFTESFVVKGGETAELRKVFGPYGSIDYVPAPKRPETGYDTFEAFWLKEYPIAVMGRHEEAGYQVWSQDHGYPGDGNYREFHKKDDRSGLNYWKLTSKDTNLGEKHLYSPEIAAERVKENSDHYVGLIQKQLHDHFRASGKPGLLLVAFDTELFGHWWFEGVEFIKQVIRKLNKYTKIALVQAGDYISRNKPEHALELPASSWGSGGAWEVWLNKETEWMWEKIHKAESDFRACLEKHLQKIDKGSDDLQKRALKQAARELLLVQSSDWPFLVTTGQAKQYAIDRFNKHLEKFNTLLSMLEEGKVSIETLESYESTDNCFQDINLDSLERTKSDYAARTK